VANAYYYCCLIVVMVPYYIFVAPDVWNNVSPVLPIATTVSVLFTLLSILLTSFTDPGIIPRRAFLMLDPVANEKYLMPNILNENGIDTRRFCSTCHIYRPERASHCSNC
jgi:palmitoyltransferase ZDHHC9/14/18